MSSSNSPCAACKFLRRKCTQECVFAPYFPPDQPHKFANVHKVFGASNVAKILNELSTAHREDAVNSLAYEADARLRDPVYGCVAVISALQHRLKQVQSDLHSAKLELANYIGPSAMLPVLNQGFIPQIPNMSSPSGPTGLPYNIQPMLGINHHQQIFESQQLVGVANSREQEMLRNYEQQQQQSGDLVRLVFNPMTAGPTDMSPALALGVDNIYQIHQQPAEQAQEQNHQLHLIQPHQILLQQETEQQALMPLQQRAPSADHTSVAPSC